MQLLRGETSLFEFQIQAVTATNDIICTYSFDDISPIIVTFDSDETTVKAGEVAIVYGEIEVPENATFGTYIGELVVSCGPKTESDSGSSVKTTIGGSRLSVSVVQFREGEKKSAEIPSLSISTELILLILVIIIILGVYYLKRPSFGRKSKKSRSKKRSKR